VAETSVSANETVLYVLRIEGQNFDSVIFDTHDLSTIAGGSRLLEMAPQHIKEILPSMSEVNAAITIQCAASNRALCAARGTQEHRCDSAEDQRRAC